MSGEWNQLDFIHSHDNRQKQCNGFLGPRGKSSTKCKQSVLLSLVYIAMRFKENSMADSGIQRWISLENPIRASRAISGFLVKFNLPMELHDSLYKYYFTIDSFYIV
jgi:hypothetical protein